jgi:rod shape-determining protein MreC
MFRNRTFALLLVLCLGHVLLISAQVQSKSGLPVLESVAFGAYARIQRFTAGIADTARSTWGQYFALRGVERENEDLRRRVLELEGQLQQQQASSSHLRGLEEIVGLKQRLVAPTMAARVIAGDPSPGAFYVTIDRGTDDGVLPDMAVLAHMGVVGRVIRPTAPRAALVQLIIGQSAAAGVVLEGSGAGAVVVGGAGDPPMQLKYPPQVDIKVGERVLTSGQDRIYPAGFEIGKVEWVEPGNSRERKVTVRPSVDFSHIEVVLVVLSRPEAGLPVSPAAKPGSGRLP